jgi:2-oxoglutarate/2-oxoacid ferredoxin oxidoreductase subunit alpha
LLTDGFLANGTEPWLITNTKQLPDIKVPYANPEDKNYLPYKRNPENLVRQWAIPGTPGHEHRIGGLEKMDITGTISYVPENHEKMVHLRDDKVRRVANYIPELEVLGDADADLLVIGWGGTYGHIYSAVKEIRSENKKIAYVHFHYLWPLPNNTAKVLSKYSKKIVCELNMGQLAEHLMANIPGFVCAKFNKIQGQPFTVVELKERFDQILGE